MIEDVVDELKTILLDKLPAETAASDLPAIRAVHIAEQDVPPTQLPVIFLLPQTTVELGKLAPVLHDEEHELIVVALHQHIDSEKLARELWQYKDLIRRVIMRDLPQSPRRFIMARQVLRHTYTRTREIEEGGAYSREVQLDIRLTERIDEI